MPEKDTIDMDVRLKENLKRLLEAKGWRAADLCRRTGLAPSVVSEWLSGRKPANIQNLQKVARELGTNIDELCFQDISIKQPDPAAFRYGVDIERLAELSPLSISTKNGEIQWEIRLRKASPPSARSAPKKSAQTDSE